MNRPTARALAVAAKHLSAVTPSNKGEAAELASVVSWLDSLVNAEAAALLDEMVTVLIQDGAMPGEARERLIESIATLIARPVESVKALLEERGIGTKGGPS